MAVYKKLSTGLAGLSLLSISYAATIDTALADCVGTVDTVVCTGTDTDGFTSTTTGLNLTVKQGATVEGALSLNNNPSLIRVDGTVNVTAGFPAIGIALNGNGGTTRIENTGSISGNFTAILQDGTSATTIVNSGSISSRIFIIPVYSGSSEILRIENSGEIFNSLATAATSHLGLTANTRLEMVNTGRITANSNSTFVGVVNAGNLATADVINSGIIEALGPNGAAIKFSGQDDRLELQAGSQITGAVLAGGGSDTLMFGGDSGTFTFDIGLVDGNGTAGATEQYQGFEIFQKEDAGTLVLTGTNKEISLFTVSGGTLLLDAQMVNADFDVSNGTIGGTGQLAMLTLNSGGILSPGTNSSVGTLNVSTATVENRSIYDVNLDADGTSDLLHATGNIDLRGGSVRPMEISQAASYARVETYTIVTADGGLTGTYDSIIDDKPLLKYDLSYDAQNVFLTRTLLDFRRFANSLNTWEAARGLLKFDFERDPEVLSSLLTVTETELPAAFNGITGEVHAEMATASAHAADVFTAQLQEKAKDTNNISGIATASFNTERFGADLAAQTAEKPQIWFDGFGAHSALDGDGNASGLKAGTWGLAGGVQTTLQTAMFGETTVGIAGGFTHSQLDIDSRNQDGSIRTGHFGVYGAFGAAAFEQGFAASGSASYAHHNVDTTRSISFGTIARTAEASYNGHTVSADIEARYNFVFDAAQHGTTAVSPFLGTRFAWTGFSDFQENGAGALNLSSQSNNHNSGEVLLGLAVSGNYQLGEMAWRPGLSVAYNRLVGKVQPTADLTLGGSPTTFFVEGVKEARDRISIGVHSELLLNQNAALTFSADTVQSEDRSDVSGQAGLKIHF